MSDKLISTTEAAKRLNLSRQRVLVLIDEGRLPAIKVGTQFVINEKDLSLIEDRPTGRPPKAKAEKKSTKKGKK